MADGHMTSEELQLWLNERGASLQVDGMAGPRTRQAIIETFRNRAAPKISLDEMAVYSERLGGGPHRLLAVSQVEAPFGGWDEDGLLACLYERHYLWRRIAIKVKFLADPSPGGYTLDADRDGINDSWEKVADAACQFGAAKAFECASWGKFQIMGAWWNRLGYRSAIDFVWRLSRAEKEHYEALCRFLTVQGMTPAFRKISANPEDCRPFARAYNGPAYEEHDYHRRIATAFRKLGG
jgi:hypothetical protein